jgi:ABC-type transport system involved in multi-copper enzyme maturation permease subunit
LSALWIVAGYALREALRRRVFVVVLVLTTGFLALYSFGADRAFDETDNFSFEAAQAGVDSKTLAGATVFGLAMFATLFLGAILAVFLTLGAVRGDADRGLLQPLVVRPVGRSTLLLGRFGGAALASALYVGVVYLAAVLITGAVGGWWPDRPVMPALELAAAVAILAAVSLLGSIFLSGTANGIAVFMVFGAGLTAGLLGQIGEALGSDTLQHIARIASWVLPFEALYQDALTEITADTGGLTKAVVDLGPFGGAQSAGAWLWPWTAAYLVILGTIAIRAFARKDL